MRSHKAHGDQGFSKAAHQLRERAHLQESPPIQNAVAPIREETDLGNEFFRQPAVQEVPPSVPSDATADFHIVSVEDPTTEANVSAEATVAEQREPHHTREPPNPATKSPRDIHWYASLAQVLRLLFIAFGEASKISWARLWQVFSDLVEKLSDLH